MAKQLIVVVHGVGVKNAGSSTDLLSSSLKHTPEEISHPLRQELINGQILRQYSSDDFVFHEYEKYNVRNIRQTFSSRIRRYLQQDKESATDNANERLIADFYWGDIVRIGPGVLGSIFALFQTILGLSHAIRENALDVFPKAKSWHAFMRSATSAAPLIIHGPIAALSLVLILSSLIYLWLESWLGQSPNEQWFRVPDRGSVNPPPLGGG